MRTAVCLLLALGAPGCLNFDDDARTDPPPRQTEDIFISLSEDSVRLAAGTVFTTRHGRPSSGYLLESSDPDLVDVRPRGTEIELATFGEGTATITARSPSTNKIVDTLEVHAVTAADVEVHYRAAPGADAPIAALAGVVGGTDHVCLRYLDAGGGLLGGAGATVATGGAVVSESLPEQRISELFAARSTCVGLRFPALGAGTVAFVAGATRTTIAVEVVEAPATVELLAMVLRDGVLAPAPDPVVRDEYIGVNLVARTGDGRFVAGLATTWTTENTRGLSDTPTETVFQIPQAGDATVTAVAGAFTRSITLRAE